jgi:Carboxypeptidase regulatory-like domain/von Willebrand factor type A domain
MAWPLIRIDLDERSRDFQRIALQPGFPVLDRFGANTSVLRQWLGRFAAEAQWDEQTVRFLWRDDEDNSPPSDAHPATMTDLREPLKAELAELQDRLKKVAPKSPNDRVLLGIMQQRLERALSTDASQSEVLFKVRVRGRWRLVWCWGYDRRHSKSANLTVCTNEPCRLAFFDDAETRHRCPRCKKKVKSGSLLRSVATLVFLALVVAGGGYLAWDRAGRPGFGTATQSVQGVVVDAVTNRPIGGAAIRLSSDPQSVVNSDPRGEFEFSFKDRGPGKLQVSAPGYQTEAWEPPREKRADARQKIALRGDSDVVGLVVEAGTDRPIPFPTIRATASEHQGTGDDVGLFLLPGMPSGTREFEVSADGFQPLRVTQELKPGRSPDLLIALTGAATLHGTVVDAYNKQPVAGASIKIVGLPGESTSDEKGIFQRKDLPGRSCQIEVSAAGYFTREFERPLAPTGESTLRFLLRPELTSFNGIVSDSSNTPIGSAKVQIEGMDIPAVSSADGQFQLAGVRRGTHKTVLSADGYPPRMVDVTVPTPDGKPARLVLAGGERLVGTVTDAGGKSPVKNAEIRLANGRWKTNTDDQGKFEITELPKGTLPLEVIGRGYRAAQLEVRTDGGETSVAIELRGSTVLSGTVTSAFDQRPIEGAEVALEGTTITRTTDVEGRFRFEDVVAGTAKVSVAANGYRTAMETRETEPDQEATLPVTLHGAATLTGKVVSAETGEPIQGAEITTADTDRKLTTNDTGEFSQSDWPARMVHLSVAAPGFSPETLDHDLSTPDAPAPTIRLKPPRSVGGRVVDARSDKPIAGARVTLSGGSPPVETDEQGRFQATAPRADSYEFSVAASGYPPQTFIERVKSGPNATDAEETQFKLALKHDSDEKPPAEPLTTDGTTPPPSAADQFGPNPRAARDPLDVEFFGIHTRAANVSFVVDCSGSMSGTRLERTKLELLKSVLNLNPKQMFYVAFFDDKPYYMFKAAKSPVIASPLNKVRTYKWMKTVDGGGGTIPEPALEFVSTMNPQSIFLLSDGQFDPLSESLYDEFKQKKIQVNTIAFEDESGRQELEGIAERTHGTYRFVPEAPIPKLYEISLVTQLYDELLEQWLDPKTSAADAGDAHDALVEFCNGEDFGPKRNAGEADRRSARDDWRKWWVEHKLTPEIQDQDDEQLKKNLGNKNFWWRWASLAVLDQKGITDGATFLPKVRDPESGIQQAARRALARLAVDEDHGPPEGAGTVAVRNAYDKWSEWWRREKYIDNLKKKPDDSLIHDFDSPDVKTRRAAVQAAADRGRFTQPNPLIERLSDPDQAVRQSAYDALVKTAGQDVGPGDCSDRSRCESAAKEWHNVFNARAEKAAEKTLRLAESFEKNNRSDTAVEWYQRVIERYPNSEAAKTAASRLKALGP